LIVANADRIIELLHEAKARPAGAERERFLAEACGDDAALKEQIVSLLKADANEGDSDFLKNTLWLRPTAPVTEKPADRIGRYKLLEQIGEGGCGVVYMADQEEPVRRRVALKVIKLGMDTKQVIARFEAERQALALMDHPNIAKVLDGGATETGRPFFVMELVRGIKITDYCDQNNLPTNERLELFIQVCQAIQHAHQKGIIHRDIKPSNILVTQHDDVAVPKVIDFGIAKATTGQLTDKTLFTPAYMSPEQAQMSGLDIDTRADIYSLGVLLYELLTGNTPFDAKELLAAGMDEMRRKIREDEPARPSTCLSTMTAIDLTTVAKHRHAEPPRLIHLIRGDLDWLVMKCLEKDRTRRYETAGAVATDLQRHLNNEPVLACPPSRSYRFQKLVQRNKLGFAAAGAVTAALFMGLGASTLMFLKEKAARLRAVTAEQAQSRSRQEAEGARQRAEAEAAHSARRGTFMMKIWGALNQTAVGRDREMLRGFLDQTAERVIKELNYAPELEAGLREEVGGGFIDAGSYTNAGNMFMEALSLRRKLRGETHPEVASAMNRLAYVRGLEQRDTEAIAMFREALALRQRLLGNEHLDVAESLFGLAEVLRRSPLQQTLGEAELLARECLRVRENKAPDSWLTAATRHQLGAILLDEKKYSEAEALLVAGYQGMKNNQPELQKAIAAGDFAFISALPRVLAADANPTGGLIRIAVAVRMRESIDRLAQLYKATDRLEKAAEWSKKIDDLAAKATSGTQAIH
jgi:tetratricopeptide (TPR) repeat protein